MIYAPMFDSLLEIFDIRNYNPQSYDFVVKEKLLKLLDLLNLIKPLADDEYKELYFCVHRGSINEYGDYEELKELGEVSSYEEFVKFFNEDYPDEVKWYKMISTRYKNYVSISINSKNIIYADMNGDDSSFEKYQLQELLDFLIVKVEECIKMLKEGTYNEYVNKNYPYKNRFGVIKRKKYWEVYPEVKKNFLDELSQEEINYFIKNASDNVDDRIKDMTSLKYFDCVALAYEKLGYEIGNLNSKELYLKYADGRDEGLSKIDDTDSAEFDKWYFDKNKFSGHPWEIISGHSFSRVNLIVGHDDDDGYYLSLDGSRLLRKIEIVKIFNVLNKNNIPIRVYNADMVKNAIIGEDYVGIVPENIFPVQCESYFEKYNPKEFVHMYDDKMLKYIKWEPLEKIELK